MEYDKTGSERTDRSERVFGGEILRLSADLFFENIGKWLLLCAIVYFPTSFIVQYVALQLPVDEVYNTLMQGDLYAVTRLDWTPISDILWSPDRNEPDLAADESGCCDLCGSVVASR